MDHSEFKVKLKESAVAFQKVHPQKEHHQTQISGVDVIFTKDDGVMEAHYIWAGKEKTLTL